jgi:hypothetical protein
MLQKGSFSQFQLPAPTDPDRVHLLLPWLCATINDVTVLLPCRGRFSQLSSTVALVLTQLFLLFTPTMSSQCSCHCLTWHPGYTPLLYSHTLTQKMDTQCFYSPTTRLKTCQNPEGYNLQEKRVFCKVNGTEISSSTSHNFNFGSDLPVTMVWNFYYTIKWGMTQLLTPPPPQKKKNERKKKKAHYNSNTSNDIHIICTSFNPDLTRNKEIHCLLTKTKDITFFQEKQNYLSLYITLTQKTFYDRNSRKFNTKHIYIQTSRNLKWSLQNNSLNRIIGQNKIRKG